MMQDNSEKTVGVIGGLGPQATLDFYSKVLKRTDAMIDQEHLQVIIHSNPKVPNRHDAIAGTGPSCAPSLVATAQSLERAGADFLVMVCNTAHAYENVIRANTSIPFLSIIEESVAACLQEVPTMRRVGVMAADGCLEANLYQNKFAEAGVECILPSAESQAKLMNLIFRIKANDSSREVAEAMHEIAQELIEQGAEIIVAACTEIPLVLHQSMLSRPLVSSTDALVDAVIAFAGHEVSQSALFEDDFQKLVSDVQRESVRVAAD